MNITCVTARPFAWKGEEGLPSNWHAYVLVDELYAAVPGEESWHEAPLGKDTVMYLTQNSETGVTRYMVADSDNKRGFGGRISNLRMHDGSLRTIEGPWSSRAAIVNQAIHEGLFKTIQPFEIADVVIYGPTWKTMGMYCGLDVTILDQAVTQHLYGWHIAREEDRSYSLHAAEAVSCGKAL